MKILEGFSSSKLILRNNFAVTFARLLEPVCCDYLESFLDCSRLHLYSHPDHFVDFKIPEILTSAFNHRELLIKETLLIQEQQPEINVDNFFTPLYLFNT